MTSENNHCRCQNSAGPSCEKHENCCPLCGVQGSEVKSFTVKHLVIESLSGSVGEGIYFLCMNEDCRIVYYDAKTSFRSEQVKVPVWFKRDADPRYACYCGKVTEDRIIKVVADGLADNLNDVVMITGAMKDADCEKNNPLGKCCHGIIQRAIEKGLTLRGKMKRK